MLYSAHTLGSVSVVFRRATGTGATDLQLQRGVAETTRGASGERDPGDVGPPVGCPRVAPVSHRPAPSSREVSAALVPSPLGRLDGLLLAARSESFAWRLTVPVRGDESGAAKVQLRRGTASIRKEGKL